jgi:hypothetical protein
MIKETYKSGETVPLTEENQKRMDNFIQRKREKSGTSNALQDLIIFSSFYSKYLLIERFSDRISFFALAVLFTKNGKNLVM